MERTELKDRSTHSQGRVGGGGLNMFSLVQVKGVSTASFR